LRGATREIIEMTAEALVRAAKGRLTHELGIIDAVSAQLMAGQMAAM
jgi:hypothetical protein